LPDFAIAVLTLPVAGALWAGVFRGRRGSFWQRMTWGAGTLGAIALLARPGLLFREGVRGRDVGVGLGSAAALYAGFQLGDRLAQQVLPSGDRDIDAIYRLRQEGSPGRIALALATVIGPAEELYWRGLVQAGLESRFGPLPAAALATAAYGGAHLVTGNPTLTLAATTAGGFWSLLYARQRRILPLIVSHIAWDLVIFLLAPTRRVTGGATNGGRRAPRAHARPGRSASWPWRRPMPGS
jgi:membrane protease YdiL (CAAX protease family)